MSNFGILVFEKSILMSNMFTIDRFATCGTGYTLNYDSGECEVRRLMILIILLMLILNMTLILFRTPMSVRLGLIIVEPWDLATSAGTSR